jgi:hypothetical protein
MQFQSHAIKKKQKNETLLKHPPKFFLWERRGKETIVAEGYCWAITWRRGGRAKADYVLGFWSLGFNWPLLRISLPLEYSIPICSTFDFLQTFQT